MLPATAMAVLALVGLQASLLAQPTVPRDLAVRWCVRWALAGVCAGALDGVCAGVGHWMDCALRHWADWMVYVGRLAGWRRWSVGWQQGDWRLAAGRVAGWLAAG